MYRRSIGHRGPARPTAADGRRMASAEVWVADEVIGRGNRARRGRTVRGPRARRLRRARPPGRGAASARRPLAAAVARARRRMPRPARGRPGPSRTWPSGGLTDLFAASVGPVLAALPDPQRHALEIALLRVAPTGSPPDQRTLPLRSPGRSAPSRRRAGLLAVDDAQWLDESSAAVVAYAVRRLADRPLGLVVSLRTPVGRRHGGSMPRPDDDRRGGLVAAVHRTGRGLEVGPLALAGPPPPVRERLGRSFPRLALVRIEAASAGNPLYALEIGRALRAT